MTQCARLVLWIGLLGAFLCLLALPLWVLGVPGVENLYAQGWKLGLNVLLFYPLAWLPMAIAWLVTRRRRAARGERGASWGLASIALVLIVTAVVVMLEAFRLMNA